ncbi:hypothetical protein [Candidatus Venteria ishoeyi]|uniref:UDP-N-acetyl-alpha-D-muramoyl-L-alanyl-L-glutamate epimerase n=1 Tax=Candidatus Venteria ishoeyi TaxID=1899563 RepID=A0A1H6F6F2_9GAMM|nr:hypothetical protein [Candidatus Venteria ishoeyi]SEH04666.1 Uncharacterised protein [Candidatus Venteria ishoeyi]
MSRSFECFYFKACQFDAKQGLITLEYALDDEHVFCEEIQFPNPPAQLPAKRLQAIERLLPLLHFIAGISYYKAAVPPRIAIETALPDPETAAFLHNLYWQGLGEFAWQNGLDLKARLQFPAQTQDLAPAVFAGEKQALQRRSLLPVGGGKDSIVSLETLRASGESLTQISVGNPHIIRQVERSSGLPYIVVQRRISPLLLKLNAQGALNGHVPISAILASILAIAAVLYDYDRIVMSNERSANVGNFQQGALDVNHQYSKSLDFEQQMQQQLERRVAGLHYFSLLRPLSELDIARRFATMPSIQQYDSVFSSCNRNHRLHNKSNHPGNWCLDCPKCRFVFLALAPFMPQARLLKIFTKNMLDDPAQQDGFDALIGVGQHKPFECVGEVEESQVAFYLLSQQADWQQSYLVKRFRAEILPGLNNLETLLETALRPAQAHQLPEDYWDLIS